MEREKVLCIGCQKTPEEIVEFRKKALDIDAPVNEFMTPTQFVIEYEETYNEKERSFYCKECYRNDVLNGL